MDDLISRQAVLEATSAKLKITGKENAETVYGYIKKLCDDIKALPSAQQWIPCSERMPDQNGKYLVVGRQKAINILKFDGGRWYGKWGVVAWMPLPSPYREEATE